MTIKTTNTTSKLTDMFCEWWREAVAGGHVGTMLDGSFRMMGEGGDVPGKQQHATPCHFQAKVIGNTHASIRIQAAGVDHVTGIKDKWFTRG